MWQILFPILVKYFKKKSRQNRKKTNKMDSLQSGPAAKMAAPFLLIGALVLAVSGLLGLFYWGTRVETRRYRLEKLKVKVKVRNSVGPDGRNLKILHISDLHLHGNDDEKVAFIRSITDDDYDLVVLTGDIFQFLDGLKYGAQLLARKPRLGAYAVFGNHDYYDYSIFNKTLGRIFKSYRHPEMRKNVEPHRIALEAGGFTVLVNQAVYVEEADLFIVGVDYPGISESKLHELMAGAPQGCLKLALFHLPKNLERLVKAGFHLAFGGHTHGGQIRLPGYGAVITDSDLHRRYASGIFQFGETQFHISRGLGADPRSNIRINCPPAGTILDVARSNEMDRVETTGEDVSQRSRGK